MAPRCLPFLAEKKPSGVLNRSEKRMPLVRFKTGRLKRLVDLTYHMSDRSENTILVTGGAGFIGTNFILQSMSSQNSMIINVDKITYAANPSNLEALSPQRYQLCVGDIADRDLITSLLDQHRPRAVINFAAELHVDRSIHAPDDFVATNIVGTLNLLKSSREYWNGLSSSDKQSFRFIHISTDEVYGSLAPADPPFSEVTRYAPNSPYAASKAGSDHLVRAWYQTYGLPTLTLNSSNNYGPYQFPEKLIPLIIHHAIDGKFLPLYGDGQQVRDWVFVEDFCRAIQRVLDWEPLANAYGVGGRNEKTNLNVVETICEIWTITTPALICGLIGNK